MTDWLAALITESGGTIRLYGKPVSVAELRAHCSGAAVSRAVAVLGGWQCMPGKLPTPRLTATITPPTCKAGLGKVVVAGYTPPQREPYPADERPVRRQNARLPSTCKRCGLRGHIASNQKHHPRPA